MNGSGLQSRMRRGVPVAPGVAVGQAIVIQSLEDLQRIRSDSILICSRMSPVYSIAFHVVRGIISERGGIMSTAATVARENGLPVVTRVRSAQRIISDGDFIKINGTDGSVQIVLKHCPEVLKARVIDPDRHITELELARLPQFFR